MLKFTLVLYASEIRHSMLDKKSMRFKHQMSDFGRAVIDVSLGILQSDLYPTYEKYGSHVADALLECFNSPPFY